MPGQNPANDLSSGLSSRRENANEDGTSADAASLPSPSVARGQPLAALAETAKDYARAARAENTRRAYDADWRHFSSWLRRHGLAQTPPDQISRAGKRGFQTLQKSRHKDQLR